MTSRRRRRPPRQTGQDRSTQVTAPQSGPSGPALIKDRISTTPVIVDDLHFKTGRWGSLARFFVRLRAAGDPYDETLILPALIVIITMRLNDLNWVDAWTVAAAVVVTGIMAGAWLGAFSGHRAAFRFLIRIFLRAISAGAIESAGYTAVFLTRIAEAIPPLMIQHVSQIGALPQTVIALTVNFEEIPRVSLSNRLELVRVFEGFWHLTVHYGFVEIPDLPSTLRAAKDLGCPVDLDNAVYFGAHDEVVRGEPGGRLLRWRLPLFAFLFRNSVRAVDLFNLPPPNFVEIGRQIEI
jgi:K+ transporter